MASRRINRLAGIALSMLLAGCMRIYPDPELPDLEVSWFADDCGDDAAQVVFTLHGLDDGTSTEVAAACISAAVEFKDVKRQRYQVDGTLVDAGGDVLARTLGEADLRNGIDERVELYFSTFSPFRVSWTFDMGASCASLGADGILIELLPDGISFAPCEPGVHYGYEQNGTYTLRLRAVSGPDTVAISPESAPFTLLEPVPTDVGTLTLSPCAPSCPEPDPGP